MVEYMINTDISEMIMKEIYQQALLSTGSLQEKKKLTGF